MKNELITTGYNVLDEALNNFAKPNLVLVTVANKDEFLFNILKFVSILTKIPLAIFSLHLKKEDIIRNLLYFSANIGNKEENTKSFDKKEWYNISNAMKTFIDTSIVISDNANRINDVENLSIRFCNENNDAKSLIIIDNLQLIDIDENGDIKSKSRNIIAKLNNLSKTINSNILLLTNHSHNDNKFINENATWVCL